MFDPLITEIFLTDPRLEQ